MIINESDSESSTDEIFRRYHLHEEYIDNQININILNNLLLISNQDDRHSMFAYQRSINEKIESKMLIASSASGDSIGIFPIPPIFVPKPVAENIYLKFDVPIIIDQNGEIEFYATIPIDIGVYRQSKDEEILMDVFSTKKPVYALYGTPERGAVCRYAVTHISKEPFSAKKYEEAIIRIRIRSSIENIIKINKMVIPVRDIILDHELDNTVMSGIVEMSLDSMFGKEVVNVKLVDAKVKRSDKTSVAAKEDIRQFTMDAGY